MIVGFRASVPELLAIPGSRFYFAPMSVTGS